MKNFFRRLFGLQDLMTLNADDARALFAPPERVKTNKLFKKALRDIKRAAPREERIRFLVGTLSCESDDYRNTPEALRLELRAEAVARMLRDRGFTCAVGTQPIIYQPTGPLWDDEPTMELAFHIDIHWSDRP